MLGNCSCFCRLLTFSEINFFKKLFQEEHYQNVKQFGSRRNMSVLIWVKTVCKGYQQTTKVSAGKERVKSKGINFLKSPQLSADTVLRKKQQFSGQFHIMI